MKNCTICSHKFDDANPILGCGNVFCGILPFGCRFGIEVYWKWEEEKEREHEECYREREMKEEKDRNG